ncbi:hypothetical protein B0H11DRAFT_2269323 [Mycena galericulata]|nr:hypothetical protein B0H11DRAFT_2277808 [Mycena galericulata]KAJ7510783.1 hypothetical protein B0H11DRAFT_2269323 [Mycena galericulata]
MPKHFIARSFQHTFLKLARQEVKVSIYYSPKTTKSAKMPKCFVGSSNSHQDASSIRRSGCLGSLAVLSFILCCWEFFFRCRLPHDSRVLSLPPYSWLAFLFDCSAASTAPRSTPFLATPSPQLEDVYDYLGTMHPDAFPVFV